MRWGWVGDSTQPAVSDGGTERDRDRSDPHSDTTHPDTTHPDTTHPDTTHPDTPEPDAPNPIDGADEDH